MWSMSYDIIRGHSSCGAGRTRSFASAYAEGSGSCFVLGWYTFDPNDCRIRVRVNQPGGSRAAPARCSCTTSSDEQRRTDERPTTVWIVVGHRSAPDDHEIVGRGRVICCDREGHDDVAGMDHGHVDGAPPGVVEPVDAEPEPAPVEPEPVAAEPEDEPDSASLVLRLPRQAHAEVEHADTRKVEGTITGEGMIVLPPGDYRLEVGASHRPGESIRWRRTLTVRAGDDLSLDIAVRKPGWLTISGIPWRRVASACSWRGPSSRAETPCRIRPDLGLPVRRGDRPAGGGHDHGGLQATAHPSLYP